MPCSASGIGWGVGVATITAPYRTAYTPVCCSADPEESTNRTGVGKGVSFCPHWKVKPCRTAPNGT